MTIISDDSLEFARRHIDGFYDSDFFPKPDEYAALWDVWDQVKKHLMSINVEKLAVQQPRAMPAPKSRGGYRIVHQLHPLDAIAYTALAHTVAPAIESKRPAKASASVFSYRIEPTTNSFFGQGNGYAAFIDRCKQLGAEHSYVLTADIADFYNRIYTHRVDNNICYVDPQLKDVAKDVESLLLQFNQKASQGIPVGPAASIIFSEAVLLDVDESIAASGRKHCRYVDDIRIFSNERVELERTEEELTEYLFNAHRLQLAAGKTRVLDSQSFLASLETPEGLERRELLSAAQPVCDYGDAFTEDDIGDLAQRFLDFEEKQDPPAGSSSGRPWSKMLAAIKRHEQLQRAAIRVDVLDSLFKLGTRGTVIDLGLVRQALRRARAWNVDALVPAVLGAFEQLGPVVPDALLYLRHVMTLDLRVKHRTELEALLKGRLFATSRFARHWLFWFLSSFEDLVDLHQVVLKSAPIEFQARAAATGRKFGWLRTLKDLGSHGAWDRRAILYAWRVMPSKERAWLKSVAPSNETEKLLIAWVQARP